MNHTKYKLITLEIELSVDEWKIIARDVAHMQECCARVPGASDWSIESTLRSLLHTRIRQEGKMQRDRDEMEVHRRARQSQPTHTTVEVPDWLQ